MKNKTWIEVNQKNIQHNIEQFRQRVGRGVKIAGVIKSNAYGYGLAEVAKIIKENVDWIAVDSVYEALEITKAQSRHSGPRSGVWENITDSGSEPCLPAGRPGMTVVVLGYTLLENLEEVINNGFHQVVANLETLEKLKQVSERLQKPAFVHLKIETGTSRQGILFNELEKYLDIIERSSMIKLAGVSTHFANIEDTTDHSYAERQLDNYKQAVQHIESRGFTDFIKHTACSAAAVLFPKTYFDMIRLGISMYGMWSSTETQVTARQKGIEIDLRPAMTWKTRVAHVKTLPAGSSVSYGCTEKLSVPTKVAVLPIGYWDGFDRKLSSVGNVLIRGQRCRVLGRVCMNMVIIDVNHLPEVKLEDEVVLLGRQGDEVITAEEIARKVGSINYEIVTRLNPQITRFIT